MKLEKEKVFFGIDIMFFEVNDELIFINGEKIDGDLKVGLLKNGEFKVLFRLKDKKFKKKKKKKNGVFD